MRTTWRPFHPKQSPNGLPTLNDGTRTQPQTQIRTRTRKLVRSLFHYQRRESDNIMVYIGATLKEVRLRLAEEDAADLAKGAVVEHEVSPAVFIQTGLELEEQQ